MGPLASAQLGHPKDWVGKVPRYKHRVPQMSGEGYGGGTMMSGRRGVAMFFGPLLGTVNFKAPVTH